MMMTEQKADIVNEVEYNNYVLISKGQLHNMLLRIFSVCKVLINQTLKLR